MTKRFTSLLGLLVLSTTIFQSLYAQQHVPTLDDPKGILEGTGNRIRHIKIRKPEDLKRPELRAYIRRARKKALTDARKLGEPTAAKPKGVVSTVKAIYAKKRRPK